jgi:serine phosphatase RsbU (regulator of sigma subunit)
MTGATLEAAREAKRKLRARVDGWPELQNAQGLQLGYPNAMQEFRDAAAAGDAAGVVQHLAGAVQKWHGDAPPNDDITFVVVRVR